MTTLWNEIKSGKKPSNCRIIDVHCHEGSWTAGYFPHTPIDDMVANADRLGIEKLCINKMHPDWRLGNRHVASYMKKYPGRIVGVCRVNQWFPGEMRDEMKRCFDEFGFRGLKVMNLSQPMGYPLMNKPDPLEQAWEFAAERKCPILSHYAFNAEIANRYPEAKFIWAHAVGNPPNMIALAQAAKNVYFDTCQTRAPYGCIEEMTEKIGVDRIVFGSDQPYSDAAHRLGLILSARISDEDKRKILGLNTLKLYGLS